MSCDPRLKLLSYSSRLTAHSCPRKYQLDKLNAAVDTPEDMESSITFAFGHIVGLGIQLVFQGKSEDEVIWELFNFWEPDLFAANDKQKKSFWLGIAAVQRFISMQQSGFLDDWELLYFEDRPAVELSFKVILPNGFSYRGFVDAVLIHKVTGKIMVLECKTSSVPNLNPAMYKNSAQAIGYSVVLDKLAPEISSYEVMYLVYLSKDMNYEVLPFVKSYLQRALWIQELLLDVEILTMYEEAGVYPMHGESCFNYYRECKYLQTCQLSTAYLTTPLSETDLQLLEQKESEYQITVTVQDLIAAQLGRDKASSIDLNDIKLGDML